MPKYPKQVRVNDATHSRLQLLSLYDKKDMAEIVQEGLSLYDKREAFILNTKAKIDRLMKMKETFKEEKTINEEVAELIEETAEYLEELIETFTEENYIEA